MGDLAGTYKSPYSSPYFNYRISYSQTARGDSRATFRVIVDVFMDTAYDYFGYNLVGTLTIGNASQTITFKDNSPTWSGTGVHSYIFTVTPTNLANTAGQAPVAFSVTSNSGASGRINLTGLTANYTTYNTAPKLNGAVNVSPSGTVIETQSSLALSGWSVSDSESNHSHNIVQRYINGVANGSWNIGKATSWTDTSIGSLSQGDTVYYKVTAYDTYGLASNTLASSTVTKNRLYAATISTGLTQMDYNTNQIVATWSSASNTNGNTNFTYQLSANYKIYNPTVTGLGATIYIVDTARTDGKPYILRTDIKNALASSNYAGTLRLELKTTNAYGSNQSTSTTVAVNYRVGPTIPVVSVDTANSTCYKVRQDTSQGYYIPNGNNKIRIKWSGGTSPIGATVGYTVYAKYGNGSYILLGVTDTSYFDYVPPISESKRLVTFKVVAKDSYTLMNEGVGSAIEFHFYAGPSLSFGEKSRTQTGAVVKFTPVCITTLPVVNMSGTWSCNGASGSILATQTENSVTLSNLTESGSYSFTVNYNDSTGFSEQQTGMAQVGPNISMFNINQYGIGVGGAEANASYALNAAGATVNAGQYMIDDKPLSGQWNTFQPVLLQINGDANTYYPVLIKAPVNSRGDFPYAEFHISRKFNAYAPDSWNTATHKGGLTFAFRWSGDQAWGGNDKTLQVLEFSEMYSKMVAGFKLSTSGIVIWLRGGGAAYSIHSDYGDSISTVIYLSGFTDAKGDVYAPRTNLEYVYSEIMRYYPIRGGQVYDEGARAFTQMGGTITGETNVYEYPLTCRFAHGISTARTDIAGHYARLQASSTAGDVLFGHATDNYADVNYYLRLKSGGGDLQLGTTSIVGYGSNAYGEYIRFYNGVQICWVYDEPSNQAINSAYGSLFIGSRNWTYPASFVAIPAVHCSQFKWGTSASWGTVSDTTTTYASLRGIDAFSRASGTYCKISAIAIGRWK